MSERLRKRSLTLAGHRTSVALEPSFWAALEQIAAHRGLSMNALALEVDAERSAHAPDTTLASALRLAALASALAGEISAEARPRR